jgi:hypothetical protein
MCRQVSLRSTLYELLLALLLNNRLVIDHIITLATKDRLVYCNAHNANNGIQRRKCVPGNGAARTSGCLSTQQRALPRIWRANKANVAPEN